MRKAQEDLLLDADAKGRIKATVLRLPDFYGPGVDKSFLHSAFVAAVKGGTADLIGPIDQPHEFVFVPDVGPIVLELAQTPQAYGKVWHFAGAGVTSQRAILQIIERQVGHSVRIRVAGKWILRILGLFNPFMREMVEMHYLLTNPIIMDDTALQTLLGTLPKTTYDEGVRQSLAALNTSEP
jgi:nucleoside-diphosphate-sugar epimerase